MCSDTIAILTVSNYSPRHNAYIINIVSMPDANHNIVNQLIVGGYNSVYSSKVYSNKQYNMIWLHRTSDTQC